MGKEALPPILVGTVEVEIEICNSCHAYLYSRIDGQSEAVTKGHVVLSLPTSSLWYLRDTRE